MFFQLVRLLGLLSVILLFSGCSSDRDNLTIDFIKPPISPDMEKKKTNNDENKKPLDFAFQRLQDKSFLKTKTSIGKKDPFLLTSSGNLSQSINNLTLKGVYTVNNRNYALISFGNMSGTIQEGYRGDSSNNLLPNNLILSKIDIKNKLIILINEDKTFQIKMNKKSTS